MKIIHDCFNSITYCVTNNNIFDMIEKVGDGIHIHKRLLMNINACNEVVWNDNKLKRKLMEKKKVR